MSLKQNMQQRLDSWLYMLIEADGADLLLKSNSQIHERIKSDIVLLTNEKLDAKTI